LDKGGGALNSFNPEHRVFCVFGAARYYASGFTSPGTAEPDFGQLLSDLDYLMSKRCAS
jgi:hypothetical protein